MLITSFKNTSSRQSLLFGMVASMVLSAGLFLSTIQPGNIHTDGGIFSAVAWKDINGGALYVNSWENKPPGIFYLIELFYLVVPGHPIYALFVMCFSAFLAFGAGLFYLFYKYLGSLVLSLLLLGISIYYTVYPDHIGDGLYTEIYGTLFLILSLAFFEIYRTRPKKIHLFLCASLLGSAFWFKEPFILVCLPFLAYYTFQLKDRKIILHLLVYFSLPSILFLVLLSLGHSVTDFFNAFLYNFQYSSHQEINNREIKLEYYYKRLIEPLTILAILLALLIYKNLSEKQSRVESCLFVIIFLCSTLFVFLSPYDFGHYYIPSFVLFFVLLARQYALFKARQNSLYLPFLLILIYSIYKIDQQADIKFTFRIEPYQPDRITQRLNEDKDATVFIDYVPACSYYIKSKKTHPLFMPVPLSVHFDNSESGKRNSARIWKELNENPPDYLITTYTNSYPSWSFPTNFYAHNYEKIDSAFPPREIPPHENVIFLWKYKKP